MTTAIIIAYVLIVATALAFANCAEKFAKDIINLFESYERQIKMHQNHTNAMLAVYKEEIFLINDRLDKLEKNDNT